MSAFAQAIRREVSSELEKAELARAAGNTAREFGHLENAHVLGQASTREHVRVHWAMLQWGLRNRRRGEVLGQIVRIVGATTKTWVGLVPTGNTGGSNVSAFRALPVAPELQRKIEAARSTR